MEEHVKQHHRVTINKIQSMSTGQMTWFLHQINYKPKGEKRDRGKAQKKNFKRPKKHVVNYNKWNLFGSWFKQTIENYYEAVGMLNTVYLIVFKNYYQMFQVLEKEMATYSSILAWRIPRTEELGGLQSIGSQKIRHDWVSMHACVRCDNVISVMFF